MYGKKYMGVLRSTFIVGADGKVAKVFPKVQPKKHDGLVLKALGELAAAAEPVSRPGQAGRPSPGREGRPWRLRDRPPCRCWWRDTRRPVLIMRSPPSLALPAEETG